LIRRVNAAQPQPSVLAGLCRFRQPTRGFYHATAVLLLSVSQLLEEDVYVSACLLCQDLSRFAYLGDDWVLIHYRFSSTIRVIRRIRSIFEPGMALSAMPRMKARPGAIVRNNSSM